MKTFLQNLPVLISDFKSGYENFYEPFIREVIHQPENMYFDGEFQNSNVGEKEAFEAVLLIRELRDD